MENENDFIQKLAIAKKMMDIQKKIPRGQNGLGSTSLDEYTQPQQITVDEFQAPQSSYNIPQEYLNESFTTQQTPKPNGGEMTKEKIMSSKLPDEIKRLMLEHPIQNKQSTTVLSNDLVEKATRLMNVNSKGEIINETTKKPLPTYQSTNSLNANEIKQIVKETVEEILKENGIIAESTSKTNQQFSFKVGQHIFEGKVNKIKKIR